MSLITDHVLMAMRVVAYAAALLSLPVSAQTQTASGVGEVELSQLDTRLQDFSSRFYAKLVRAEKPAKIKSIGALKRAIGDYRAQDQSARALATAIDNVDVVEKNIDDNATPEIIELLLRANEWKTASRLYNKLRDQGDKGLVSNASLSLTKYYFARNQWDKSAQIAQSIAGDIALEDYHHARLMHGVALQRLRKHRAALTQYAKIPKTSRYYAEARLNMAVANVRQDWWTDAHRIMEKLVKDSDAGLDAALTDRLYTVWGYSLLRQQYFRNARDVFRNVSLDGPYTNKALLGIALSAAYQNDYVGALNAIRILQKKSTYDLPVDEANLLMPYMYEKLEQRATAMAGYSQAVKYYEDRIASIEKAMPATATALTEQVLAGGAGTITANQEVLNLDEKLPRAFFDNIRTLASYRPQVERMGDAALSREHSALTNDYASALQKATQDALREKVSYLDHYMSQARFGLATINDTGAAAP